MGGAQVTHPMHPPGPHPRILRGAGYCRDVLLHHPGDQPRSLWSSGKGVGRSPHLPICVHSWLPEVLQAQALTVVHHHHHLNLLAQLEQKDGGDQAGPTGRSRDGVVPNRLVTPARASSQVLVWGEGASWELGQGHGLRNNGNMDRMQTCRVGG